MIRRPGRPVADLKTTPPAEGITLSRWSRLKRAAAEQAALPVVRPELVEGQGAPEPGVDELSQNGRAGTTPPAGEYNELPPMSAISLAEDFTPFMQAKVPQALKQQALKALFKEPHFNVMDGLDIYIDDYTVFEPISPEVMATLSSWKAIMNPPQQVVTKGGYAVDVASDEGKATLAERAALAEANALLPPSTSDEAAAVAAVTDDAADAAPAPAAIDEPNPLTNAAIPHARYGKRVGDFSASAYAEAEVLPPDSEPALDQLDQHDQRDTVPQNSPV